MKRFLNNTETRRMTDEQRFFHFLQVGDGCWEWQGPINHNGYGIFYMNGKKRLLAHRYSYERKHGAGSLRGQLGLHRCDNPKCVRPGHLFAGDDSANHQDKMRKTRAAKAVTAEMIVAVRAARAAGESYKGMAPRFGVSWMTVRNICNGERSDYAPSEKDAPWLQS